MLKIFHRILPAFLALLLAGPVMSAPTDEGAGPAMGESARQVSPQLRAALEKLDLPGVKINIDAWCVDVRSQVCLDNGLLELIACIKDTKEHESIIMVEAKPSHIHTALLLLGARPGHPARREFLDEDGDRFIDLPPRGGPIDVFLVIEGKETPISAFLRRAEDPYQAVAGGEAGEDAAFPTHTFLFAGSVLIENEEGPRTYLCDIEGNVISLSTFGDELLCLPGVHSSMAGELIWEVAGEKLPKVGSEVTLRLRPVMSKPPPPKPEETAEAPSPGQKPGDSP